MGVLKKICFLFLIMTRTFLASAQAPAPVETREIWLSISSTTKHNDTIVAVLEGPHTIGITSGQLLRAYQSSIDAITGVSEKKEFAETGSGQIFIYQDTIIAAIIRMYNPADSLMKGDMVSLRHTVPSLSYRGIFSELAFQNIIFTNIDKSPLYSLADIFKNDSRRTEDSVFNIIVQSLHNTYEKVKERTDLPASLFIKPERGRFKGRIPLGIIRDVTRKELEAFFMYIAAYPVSYRARNYRASESFAGWLISNSPYSVGEVQRGLFPYYKKKEEFKKRILEYKQDVLNESTSKRIAEDALELAVKLKYEEAHAQTDFAIALAEAVKDTVSLPTVYIWKAQMFLEQEKYPEAIVANERAINAAIMARDRDIEMQALIKKGFCFYKISRYKEAETALNTAATKLLVYRSVLGELKYKENVRKIYEYRSSINFRSGHYEKALQLLDTALIMNNQINSYDAKITNAGYYTFIGRVYNDQGRPVDAILNFEKGKTIYHSCSDVLNKAIVENDIAYSYYLLGDYRKSITVCNEAKETLIQQKDYNNAGYSQSLIGGSYWTLGKYDSALASHKEAIVLRKKGGNANGEAYSWKKMGELYQLSGSKKMALRAIDSAMQLYQRLRDSSGLADVYNFKGGVYLDDENYKKATEWLEKARGVSSKSPLESLFQTGVAWFSIDSIKSKEYFIKTRQQSIADGNTGYQFSAAKLLAMLAYRSQDISTGNQYYEECVLLSRQLNTASALASCFALKAFRFENETELDSALVYYKQAMVITDTIDKKRSVSFLNDMASMYISKGEFSKADSLLTKAVFIAKNISDSIGLGNTLQFSSFLYSRTAEFEKGLANNDSAIYIFLKAELTIRLAGTFNARGSLLSSMGENKDAVIAYLYADSLYKNELMEESRRMVFNNIGIVYTSQGDYANALKYLKQALVIRKGKAGESYLLVQGNIAECLQGLKRSSEAKALLLDVLPQAKKLNLNRVASGMSLILGKIYLEENNLTQAATYYRYAKDYAIESGEKEKAIDALINLGRIAVRERKETEAKVNFRLSVEMAAKYKTAGGWEAYYEMGLLYYDTQQFDSSIVYFSKAVTLLDDNAEKLYGGEEARKIFNNDPRKSDLYSKITFSYYNVGNIKEAWAFANRSNIAGIKELSGSLSVNSSDEERNEALKKLLTMQQSKKALENNLEKQEGVAKQETLKKIEILEADYKNFLFDVMEQYPELGTYFSKSNANEFNDYKGKLPEDVAVTLYLLNDKTLMIFTLTNEKLAVDTMTMDIAPRIAAFIEAIKNTNKQTGTGPLSVRSEPQDEDKSPAAAEFKDISDELYKALITVVSDKISSKKRLCIIPTGVFSNMPFQCLGEKVDATTFRFLIEDYTLFYTSKMSVFREKNDIQIQHKNSLSSFAAFGVPDATLRFNISEVKTIGKILGSDSTVYADERATESMAKQSLQRKKYVHFATHGVLNYSSEYRQSYLKLLADKDTVNGNNGKLTMREVLNLDMKECNMVILSACQTAVSKELVKGWNISTANSFLEKNVKTVVATLWKVADEPTSLLMEYFYKNLKNMDKSEALRHAQIQLSKDPRFVHPNYWGAFVLYGDWR